jgi:hypothetical protein
MSGKDGDKKENKPPSGTGSQASQESTESTVSNSAYLPQPLADTGSPPDFSRLTPSLPLEETELFAASSSSSSTSNSTPPKSSQVSGNSSTLFATPKADSKLFCFSLSHAISLYPNIDNAIKESKGEGAVWNRLKDRVAEGKLQLEAHPQIKEITMSLMNAGHQVAIFTGINHPETEAIIRGFLSEVVKLGKAVSDAMTITYIESMKDASEVNSLKVSQVAEIRKKLRYPPARTVVVDAGVLHQLYTSQGYTFYSVDDEQLRRDAGLVPPSASTSSSSSMDGGGRSTGATATSKKRKREEDGSGFGPG